MTPRQLAPRARAALREAADAHVKAQQRSYFKPREKVVLYGVATPEVRSIERGLYDLVRKDWRYAADARSLHRIQIGRPDPARAISPGFPETLLRRTEGLARRESVR
jgi:hypothetical protein